MTLNYSLKDGLSPRHRYEEALLMDTIMTERAGLRVQPMVQPLDVRVPQEMQRGDLGHTVCNNSNWSFSFC